MKGSQIFHKHKCDIIMIRNQEISNQQSKLCSLENFHHITLWLGRSMTVWYLTHI